MKGPVWVFVTSGWTGNQRIWWWDWAFTAVLSPSDQLADRIITKTLGATSLGSVPLCRGREFKTHTPSVLLFGGTAAGGLLSHTMSGSCWCFSSCIFSNFMFFGNEQTKHFSFRSQVSEHGVLEDVGYYLNSLWNPTSQWILLFNIFRYIFNNIIYSLCSVRSVFLFVT